MTQPEPKVTVIQAAGQNYAVHLTPLDALKLADTARILKLQDGTETIYLRGSTVTTAAEWVQPTHHGRTWHLKDAAKPGRPPKPTS